MERILSAKQMRLADEYTINTLKIPHDELVLRAGTAVASEITKRFLEGNHRKNQQFRRIHHKL